MQVKRVSSPANQDTGAYSSTWMLASDNASFFNDPVVAAQARDAVLRPGLRLWTDDYSTLLPILR